VNRTTNDQEFFGLHEMVSNSYYQQELTTLADSYIIKIPAQALHKLFEEDAEVRRYLMLQLCRSMDMAEKEFE
jgi:CRP-like cAMP-binding protein